MKNLDNATTLGSVSGWNVETNGERLWLMFDDAGEPSLAPKEVAELADMLRQWAESKIKTSEKDAT